MESGDVTAMPCQVKEIHLAECPGSQLDLSSCSRKEPISECRSSAAVCPSRMHQDAHSICSHCYQQTMWGHLVTVNGKMYGSYARPRKIAAGMWAGLYLTE